MRTFGLAVAACALVTLMDAKPAHALSGNDLFSACQYGRPVSKDVCYGYVVGALAQISAGRQQAQRDGTDYPWNICISNEYSYKQYVELFVAYLGKNKAQRHIDASWLFLSAMEDAIPCN